ncbi:MAG: hypothetical protein KC464_08870, partial [Myxococcales bacterium]|nr:hypothetical protein [Myxococcales bacterium]
GTLTLLLLGLLVTLATARRRAAQRAARARADHQHALEAQRLAAHTERLVVLGRLTAGIGHELGNPLTALLGNLDLLDRALARAAVDANHEATMRRHLGGARDAGQRLRGVAEGLRRFAHPAHTPGRVDPADAIETALRLATARLDPGVDVVRELAAVPPVVANEPELVQVVLNLISNAIDAMPTGHVPRQLTVRCAADQGRVVIEVGDRGTGLPAEVRARLYEPFVTTKPPGLGTGLGLSLCHALITASGGSLRLDDRAGGGTLARIELPAAPQDGTPTVQGEMHASGHRAAIAPIAPGTARG